MKDVSERLKELITMLNISPYEFSKVLGYKSPDSIYHILNGKQSLSRSMIENINTKYSQVNINWVLFGKGAMFNDPLTALIGQEVNVNLKDFEIEGVVSLIPCKVIDVIIDDYYFKEKGEPIFIKFQVSPLFEDPEFPNDIDRIELEERLENVYLEQITL